MSDLLPGLTAALSDRYRIERELGQGGMATVYLAHDLRHDRQVAVKVLRPELAAALGADRFLREIHIAAQLQHPHILPLHDSGEANGFLYYVMPYVEGESLRARLIREGELPVHEAVKLLIEIVDALGYAHGRGVVHRDVKPDNVMLSGRHALVMDFGVAKAISEASGRNKLTTIGVALGTPAYMAPEQAVADPHLDHRVDIYAVGVMAYELLAGRPPFVGATPQQVLAAQVTTAPEPLSKFRPGVSPALEQVVMRCLAKRPADRFQSATDLLGPLESLTTPGGGMTPTGTQPIAVGRPRARRMTLALVVTALVVIGVTAVLILRHPQLPIQPNVVAVATFENRTGDQTLDEVGARMADDITGGLAAVPLAHAVDRPAVRAAELGAFGRLFRHGSARDLGEATGAGVVVSGRYTRVGDSLVVTAEIDSGATGSVIRALTPARVAVADPPRGMGELRDRLLGGIGLITDAEAGGVAALPAGDPPPLDAYREWAAGRRIMRHAGESDQSWEALPHFGRAVALDTAFYSPAMWLSYLDQITGHASEAESVRVRLERVRGRLTPLEDAEFDVVRALAAGDPGRALAAERRAVALVGPRSSFTYDDFVTMLAANNLLHDALTTLQQVGPVPWDSTFYYMWAPHLLVYLGDNRAALASAREGMRLAPRSGQPPLQGMFALIAMDSVPAALRILQSVLDSPSLHDWEMLRIGWVALALQARGHGDAAAAPLAQALSWFRSRTSAQAVGARWHFLMTLDAAGLWDEARAVAETMAQEGPAQSAWLGVIAAHRGDTVVANRVDRALAATTDPLLRGDLTYDRARIAAVLGHRDDALALLRDAFAHGANSFDNRFELRLWPEFRSLQSDPGFKQLLVPADEP